MDGPPLVGRACASRANDRSASSTEGPAGVPTRSRCSIGSLTHSPKRSRAPRRPAPRRTRRPARRVTREESRSPPAKAGGASSVTSSTQSSTPAARTHSRRQRRCRAWPARAAPRSARPATSIATAPGKLVGRPHDERHLAAQAQLDAASRRAPRRRARSVPRSVVPLWLPRSRTQTSPSRRAIERCRRLTAAEATATTPDRGLARRRLERAPDDDPSPRTSAIARP